MAIRAAVTRVPLLVWLFSPPPARMNEEAAGWPPQICIPDGQELPAQPGRCLWRGPGAFLLPAAFCCLWRRTAALPVQSNLPSTLSVCSGLTETLFLFQLDPGVGGAGWEEEQFSLRPDHGRYLQTFSMTLYGYRPASGIVSCLGVVVQLVGGRPEPSRLVALATVPVYP